MLVLYARRLIVVFMLVLIVLMVLFYGFRLFKVRVRPPLTKPVRSYVRSVNGNPTLFVDGRSIPMLGLRTTSDPYESDEEFRRVLEYIDKASKYGYSYVEVLLNWYTMDKSYTQNLRLDRLPKPEDVGKLMDWSRLDYIFDYAARKGVYIIPFFWHNIPPRWWFEHVRNYKDYLQTSHRGRIVLMMSFNNPKYIEYEKAAIKAIIMRYRNHPAYLGFHLQFGYTNENNYPGEPQLKGHWFDYSPFTQQKFREWLEERYGDISNLRRAWGVNIKSFKEVKPPKPLSDIKSFREMVEWINSAGDCRRSFYDWQLFRFEQKRKEREELAEFIKSIDPNHILIMPASLSLALRYTNSLPNDFDHIASSPHIDIVHFCPGMVKPWTTIHKAGEYIFVKYFESRGKAAFIKWEGRKSLRPDDLDEPVKRAKFAREIGCGGSLWEGRIAGYPEFSEKQIEVFAKTFLTTPEGGVRRSKIAVLLYPFIYNFDYRKGIDNLRVLSHYKNKDLALFLAMLYMAGIDFDIITRNEVVNNPKILSRYRAVFLSNLYRIDSKLLEILVEYRDKGGILFIQGRTGIADEYGRKNLNILKKLLGINSPIYEYHIVNYSWTYLNIEDPLLKGIRGLKGDSGKLNLYYIPVFNYKKEGFKIIATLDQNKSVAVVGYKKNIIFWFPKLGIQIIEPNRNKYINNTIKFLKNLYTYIISTSPTPNNKPKNITISNMIVSIERQYEVFKIQTRSNMKDYMGFLKEEDN